MDLDTRRIAQAAAERYIGKCIRYDQRSPKDKTAEFPVLVGGNRVESSLALSATLATLPAAEVDLVFVDPEKVVDARAWFSKERESLLRT